MGASRSLEDYAVCLRVSENEPRKAKTLDFGVEKQLGALVFQVRSNTR